GNALGDTPDLAIGPETFGDAADHAPPPGMGRKYPRIGRLADAIRASGGAPVGNTQTADALAAPDYRPAGNAVGAFTRGAASEIGKGAGKLVDLAVPAGVGGVAGNAARAVGAYEVAAPTTAALSASAEGDRLHAAREAATDPAGLVMSGLGGVGEGGGARAGVR